MIIELTTRRMLFLFALAAATVAILITNAGKPENAKPINSSVRPPPSAASKVPPECAVMERMEKEYADASAEWYALEPLYMADRLTARQKIRRVELQSLFERLSTVKMAYAIQNAEALGLCGP